MKICDKIKALHLQEKVVCIFCLMISAILILNIVVDLIHIGIFSSTKNNVDKRLNNLETRVEAIEERVN